QPLGVDVVEGDGGVGQLRKGEDVAEQVPGELDAAGADEGYSGHERKCFRSDRNDQECSRRPSSARSTSCPPPAAAWPCSRPTSAPSCARGWPPPGWHTTRRRCASSRCSWCRRWRRRHRRCCSIPRSRCRTWPTAACCPAAPACWCRLS